MADPLGLAVGFIGLAGLFSTCVDCFKLVEVYESRSKDYEVCQTMLDNQQFHLMAWGKACGFMDLERLGSRFDDPLSEVRNRRIEQTMEQILSLLTNGDDLKHKYGLKVRRASVGAKAIGGPAASAFSKVFQNTKAFWNTSLQRRSYITGTIKWAVSDKEKFEGLIQSLRDLLYDLNKFTEDMGVAESSRLVVEYEIELIDDEPSLGAIAAVGAEDGEDDIVSQAVSRRLSRVKAQSTANQSVRFDDSVSMASALRYAPSMNTVDEEIDEAAVDQDINITRIPLSQWRKVKTRAGILPWLGVLLVATDSVSTMTEVQDNTRAFSRSDTFESSIGEPTETRPVRLAINSRNLIGLLQKFTGHRLSTKHNVLVYPFKPLIAYRGDLQRYTAAAKSRLETKTTAAISVDSNTPADPGKLERVVKELQCLLEFMDNDMAHLFEIVHSKQQIKEIEFTHLWLLFQPGDMVVSCPDGERRNLRAYRILHVSGGRPIIEGDNYLKSESLDTTSGQEHYDQDGFASIAMRECTNFVIDCYYMDYDGTTYGPRPQRYVIPEFTGKRQCASLPITYLTDDVRVELLTRGRKYQASNLQRHWRYHELTLPDWDMSHRTRRTICFRSSIHERVDGEVVIDFATTTEQLRSSGCSWDSSFGVVS